MVLWWCPGHSGASRPPCLHLLAARAPPPHLSPDVAQGPLGTASPPVEAPGPRDPVSWLCSESTHVRCLERRLLQSRALASWRRRAPALASRRLRVAACRGVDGHFLNCSRDRVRVPQSPLRAPPAACDSHEALPPCGQPGPGLSGPPQEVPLGWPAPPWAAPPPGTVVWPCPSDPSARAVL